MSRGKILIGAALAALLVGGYAFTFVVYQWEVALKLRLGEIVTADYAPGLHFRVPGLHQIKKFDGRIQTLDARPERFLTSEKKDVIVDWFAKWRLSDGAQYYRSTGGSLVKTGRLLAERINARLRDEFGRRTIRDVVSGERSEIMQRLTKEADTQANELGVEVIDVRIKRIDLPPEVSGSVFERMRAERERVAKDLRAKGAEAAERIRAEADRKRIVILADARRTSEELRGDGDAKATDVYANAYTRDPGFFAFYRSLNAYRAVFGKGDNLMLLSPDSEFFRYFKSQTGKFPTE